MTDPLLSFPRPVRLRLAGVLYQALLHLAAPALLGLMWLKARREPLYAARFRDRLGIGLRAPQGCVWVFAASLGETRAVAPLVRALLADGHHVLMTHSTPAGLIESRKRFADEMAEGRLTAGYMAADFFWAVALFLRRNRPVLGLVVESELWPGMLFGAHRCGVPMVQVNGNLVDRTVERDAHRLGGVRLLLFGGFQMILTKSEAHADRYRRAGVPADRIRLVGELKFDQRIDPALIARADAIRANWGDSRRTVMIASSVEEEEPALLGLVAALARLPDRPRILWVPRSPQRFAAVAARVADAGHSTALRSAALADDLSGDLPDKADVIIGDSIGEMSFYYQLADIVFVGATLADHGGHTIIEPLALGRPVLVGPSLYGITFPAYEAIAAGAAESLPDAEALAERLGDMVNDDRELTKLTDAASGFCAFHRGATWASMSALRPWLPMTALALRAAKAKDAELLWQWRNDPASRAMSGEGDSIKLARHMAWYDDALADPDRQILIGSWDGVPIGMVRFDKGSGGVTVSIALSPDARGRGLSRPLLARAIDACRFETSRLRARVRSENTASLALFSALGFRETAGSGLIEFILEREPPK